MRVAGGERDTLSVQSRSAPSALARALAEYARLALILAAVSRLLD